MTDTKTTWLVPPPTTRLEPAMPDYYRLARHSDGSLTLQGGFVIKYINHRGLIDGTEIEWRDLPTVDLP